MAVALAVGLLVFLGGNVLMYVLLYPETVLPAPAPAPAAEVASAPAEQSAAVAPTSAPVQPTAAPAQAGAPAQSAADASAAGASLLGETGRWRPVSGSWVLEGGSARQTQAEGFDYLLVYDAPFQGPQLDVRFAHETGIGAGIMFNLPQTDRVNGGHLARYLDAGTLIWGRSTARARSRPRARPPWPIRGTANTACKSAPTPMPIASCSMGAASPKVSRWSAPRATPR
ncbi:MAG: hypothetical protein IPK19_05165 [Chloroflexi bacterium]|nr:hypothetical protein [Chloroflexota bacterium]